MANDRLNSFLIEDVTELVNFILENEAVQAIATPGTGFDTMADFAFYWSNHIKKLSE